MKRCSLINLIFLFVFQSTTYCKDMIISLKNEPLEIHNRDFYIEDLIDARTQKENIGYAKTGLLNQKSGVQFKTDLRTEILGYLSHVLPQKENQIPVIIKITYLNVSERTGLTGEYAKAEIELSFYKKRDDQLGKVYEAEAFYEIPSSLDVTKYHESNIRLVINQCLEKFSASEWRKQDPAYENAEWVSSQITESDTTFSVKAPDPGNIRNIILFGGIQGLNGSGGSLTYYRYYSKDTRWVVPWSLTGNFLEVNNYGFDINLTRSKFIIINKIRLSNRPYLRIIYIV